MERPRIEGQREHISRGASGRWSSRKSLCAKRRAAASKQGRSASDGGQSSCTLDRRARVEHHSASRGGICIECHAGRGEGSFCLETASMEILLPLCRCRLQNNGEGQRTARCSSPRERSDYLEKTFGDEMDCIIGKTGTLLRDGRLQD